VTTPRSPLEQALDLMVFAPLGLAITAIEDFPELAQKGRVRLQQRAATAKIVGQFAVAEGRRRLQSQMTEPAPRPAPQRATPGSSGVSAPAPAAETDPEAPPAASEAPEPGAPAGGVTPDSEDLAIPGYDSLSASQVVQRLASLSAGELDAVRDYEATTRGRRTILARISQLQQS